MHINLLPSTLTKRLRSSFSLDIFSEESGPSRMCIAKPYDGVKIDFKLL